MEKCGKIGLAGILVDFVLSGAAGGLADVAEQGTKGDIEKAGKSDTREFWREWRAEMFFFLSGATALRLLVGEKETRQGGKIGRAGILAGPGAQS